MFASRTRPSACRLISAVLVALIMIVPAPGWAEQRVIETDVQIRGTPEADGDPVRLDVTMLTTDPATPKPGIVLAHGFGGSKLDGLQTGRSLARAGYTVITYTARGFGASGGRIHLNNPAYEGADARKIIDWAVSRREVAKSGGDPVIGFAGGSYGGALSLLVAGLDTRVDAIVPAFTWNRLGQSLFPQNLTHGESTSLADVAPADRRGVFKQRWASLLFLGGGGQASERAAEGPTSVCGRFAPELCSSYLTAAESGQPSDRLLKLLDESSPARVLSKITAPALIIQGEDDTLFPLDQADANLRGLPASTPAAMKWVEGGHDAEIVINDLLPDLEAWFGRYLKQDGSPADTSFSVAVPETSLVGSGSQREPKILVSAGYPGRVGEIGQRRFRLKGDAPVSGRAARRNAGSSDQSAWHGPDVGHRLERRRVRPGRAARSVRNLHHRAVDLRSGSHRQRPDRAGRHVVSALGHRVRLGLGPRAGHRGHHQRAHQRQPELSRPTAACRVTGPACWPDPWSADAGDGGTTSGVARSSGRPSLAGCDLDN